MDIEQMKKDLGGGNVFPIGEENVAFAKYFTGECYLNMLTTERVPVGLVTFAPGTINAYHIHHKGGQILLVTGGRGWYQEEGKPARELKAGDVVNISPEVKHWHGAAKKDGGLISWQRSHRQQEEMLWEHLHRSLHISTMMFCSERIGTTKILI